MPAQEYGAGDRSRTYDLRITNALLYQLSYTGLTANRNLIAWPAILASRLATDKPPAPDIF